MSTPIAIIVCGPSGSGKSTIGKTLAERMQCDFAEGDEYHSAENVLKMRNGIALNDSDRWPWLHQLRTEVIEHHLYSQRTSVVLACSALRREYRDILRGTFTINKNEHDKFVREPQVASPSSEVFFVLLEGDVSLIAERMSHRTGHYMPTSLLTSQLNTLEHFSVDEVNSYHDSMIVDVTLPISNTVDKILSVVMHRNGKPNVQQSILSNK